MANKDSLKLYKQMCKVIDDIGWTYERDEEKLRVDFSVNGDDLPIKFMMKIDESMQLISVYSYLDVNVKPEDYSEFAIAICLVNRKILNGSFDFNPINGTCLYRINSSYRESIIDDALFRYLLSVVCSTVDRYNDKLFMLAAGKITLTQFNDSINS